MKRTITAILILLLARQADATACDPYDTPSGQVQCDKVVARPQAVGTPNLVINIPATPTGAPVAAGNALEVRGPDATPKAWITSAGGAIFKGTVGLTDTSPDAQLDVEASTAATIPLIVQGAASQSANLINVQNSSATPVVAVDANGGIISSAPNGVSGMIINVAPTPTGTPAAAGNALEVRGPDATPRVVVDASGAITSYPTSAVSTVFMASQGIGYAGTWGGYTNIGLVSKGMFTSDGGNNLKLIDWATGNILQGLKVGVSTVSPANGTVGQIINIAPTPTGTPAAPADALQVRGPDTTPRAWIGSLGTVWGNQPYGQYMRSANITVANVATPVAIVYDATPIYENLLARTPAAPASDPTSDIYITKAGTYEIIVSAVTDLTTGTNKHVGVWLRKNGNDVAWSNTWIQIPNASTEGTLAVAFVEQFAAGDRFTVMVGADDTNVRLLAAAPVTTPGTSPAMPGTPSVILTVKMIAK